jgi:asparagine synthase (glutamine-hydrolysing)
MSGFAGIVSTDGATSDSNLLERIAERLAFRGPDATQIWSRAGAGFCFTLLRTGPAPQSSEQPCTLDGRRWLLGDVRLDGRDALRRQLGQTGESLAREVTDEELVLFAWRLQGEECLKDLLGDFSFVLWDAETRRLWCARDLLGAKPFFYWHVGSRLVFSNTLDVVRLLPEVSSALDRQFIGDFLLQSWCPDAERTAFRDVRRLPAGHALEFSNREIHLRRYTSLPIEEPLWLKRGEQYVEEFRALLEAAVCDRLPQGPAAIFLSGGMDSTSVVATAKKIQAEQASNGLLKAFTVEYTPLFEDEEGVLASLVAQHLQIPIDILSGASCAPFEGLDSPHLSLPEPCHEPLYALHLEHFRRVANYTRVAFSGDGGDSVLTGQAWPYFVYLFQHFRFKTIFTSFGGYFLKHGRVPPLRAGIRARLRNWVWRSNEFCDYPEWLDPHFEQELHLRERWRFLQQVPKKLHPLHPEAYAGLGSTYWAGLREGEDAGWTGLPVETRAPLLDERLLRFLLRVPSVPWCMEKELLRCAMRGRLPEVIRLRHKTPLQGDPLLLHAKKHGWKPVLQEEACQKLRGFVDCKKLGATFSSAQGSSLWANSRPMALHHWLKGIENDQRTLPGQTGRQ